MPAGVHVTDERKSRCAPKPRGLLFLSSLRACATLYSNCSRFAYCEELKSVGVLTKRHRRRHRQTTASEETR